MKRIIFSIGTLFMIGGCIVSCSSDDSVDCPADFTGALATNEEKLVGEWVLTAIVSEEAVDITDDDTENPSTDIFAQYEECQRDGVYTFNSNRSFAFEQGANATDCENKGGIAGTWQLSSNVLSLVYSCGVQNLIVTFNGSETDFSFSSDYTVTSINGNAIQTEITFTYSLTE